MATKRDDDRHRITKDATNVMTRDESGEAVQVAELFEVGHSRIVTVFLPEEKSSFT